jgi:hypothetical protein
MLFMPPIWHPFVDISANAEAALISSSSQFSLSTLAVTSDPGFHGFALTEKRQDFMWRWVLVSVEGPVVAEGWEPTESDAKRSVVVVMRHVIEG